MFRQDFDEGGLYPSGHLRYGSIFALYSDKRKIESYFQIRFPVRKDKEFQFFIAWGELNERFKHIRYFCRLNPWVD